MAGPTGTINNGLPRMEWTKYWKPYEVPEKPTLQPWGFVPDADQGKKELVAQMANQNEKVVMAKVDPEKGGEEDLKTGSLVWIGH